LTKQPLCYVMLIIAATTTSSCYYSIR